VFYNISSYLRTETQLKIDQLVIRNSEILPRNKKSEVKNQQNNYHKLIHMDVQYIHLFILSAPSN